MKYLVEEKFTLTFLLPDFDLISSDLLHIEIAYFSIVWLCYSHEGKNNSDYASTQPHNETRTMKVLILINSGK